jgi:hypothetical protein
MYTYLKLLKMQILGKLYVTEKNSSILDSAPQKSINLAKIFKTFSTTVKMQACVISCR